MIASPETPQTGAGASLETSASTPTIQWDGAQEPVGENLYLIGRPTLKGFLGFVRRHAVNPPGEGVLIEEWQAGNECVRILEKEEAGVADGPPMTRMGSEYEPLLIEFLKDPLVRHGFNTVPTDVAIVELDRLVVYQKHSDVTHTGRIEARLGPAHSEEQIFRTCLPYDHPRPPVKWSRVHDNRFVFMSPSNDLRFLGSMEIGRASCRERVEIWVGGGSVKKKKGKR